LPGILRYPASVINELLKGTDMGSILGFFQVGEAGFFLLVLCLIADIVLYILYRKQQQ
jgi:hypothetical protein